MRTFAIKSALAALLLAALTSCGKSLDEGVDPIVEKEKEVTIQLSPAVLGEPSYEVTSCLVLAYDADGAKVFENGSASLAQASVKLKVGKKYSFYALINAETITQSDKATQTAVKAFVAKAKSGAYGANTDYEVTSGTCVNIPCGIVKPEATEATEAVVEVTAVTKNEPDYQVSSALFLVYDSEGTKVFETERASLDTISVVLSIGRTYSFYVLLNAESLTEDDYATEDKVKAFMDRMNIGAFGSYLGHEVPKTGCAVNVVCTTMKDDFRYSDQTTAKTFDFLEYERIFALDFINGNNSVSVDIPDECKDWVKVAIVTEKDEFGRSGPPQLRFLLKENDSDATRSAHIVIRRLRSKTDLTLDFTQLGNRMDGSLRKAMTAFYDALDGKNWAKPVNWNTDKPLIEWDGMGSTLEENWRTLKYMNKDVFGETGNAYFGTTDDKWSIYIAASILDKYGRIDVAGRDLNGTIPEEFWRACEHFEKIELQGQSNLKGSVMPDYVWHKGLKVLRLQRSNITLSFTNDALKNAESIEEIDLEQIPLNCQLPSILTQMTTLRKLHLRCCELKGELPSDIGKMKNLEYFSIPENPDMYGTLPESFYEMESIKSFNISFSKIGGTLKDKIKNLHTLESLAIRGCEFEGPIPEVMGTMDNFDGWSFDMNYFTELPQFFRYVADGSRKDGKWDFSSVGGCWCYEEYGHPLCGSSAGQRKKATGRPDDFILYWEVPHLRLRYYICNYDKYKEELPLPIWAHIRYGAETWSIMPISGGKFPVWPYADDLQYPATEYYYDGKNWVHPELKHPAREYYYNEDLKKWVHDASCPWDKEYIPE